MTSSRRRGSTVGSTGLDYSNSRRVDEDITCRIRSLLLSRNDHCPPRTPCPSDERNHRNSELDDTVGIFDFSTAKSVANLARQGTGRLDTSETRRCIARCLVKSAEMEPQRSARPSLPSLKLPLPRLHSSSSANDLKVPADDTIQSPMTPNADPDFPGETKTRFRLPRLVLQDKKISGKVKSCIEINPPIPANDIRIHETELLCCPPCDPEDVPKSKYTTNYSKWDGGNVRARPGDLACFLASSPPGHHDCKKHHRRRESVPARDSITDRRIGEDFMGVAEGLAHDIARLATL